MDTYKVANYIEDVKKTEIKDYTKAANRLNDIQTSRLLHGAIGISTEAGELLDAFKKFVYYGKNLDFVNVKEEIGDLFWYTAIICDELNISFEEIMSTNIKKLSSRYPEKFSEENANKRNLKKERKILENK